MIRIWEGYVSPRDTRVAIIVFEGRRLGGVALALDGRNVEFTVYRARDGQVVVHEVHIGKWGAGFPYDQSFVRVFSSLDAACARLNIDKQHIDPRRRNTNSRRVNAPDAPTITLEQLMRER